MKTIVGIRPTGKLHIGHYFSVIKPAQKGYDVLVAHLHNSPPDEEASASMCERLSLFGLTPHIQRLKADLYFELLSVAKMGELERMTQYKSAKVKTPHLLLYPVLMAHDLCGYHKVVVGEDQKQHIEYANVLFKRLNWPQIKGDYRSGRIMSLTNPSKKMSKSEPEGCLFLDDDFEAKLRKAITTPDGVKNLTYIAKQFGMKWNPKNNAESKKKLANILKNKFGISPSLV